MKLSDKMIPEAVKQYAAEDIADVIKLVQDYPNHFEVKNTTFEATSEDGTGDSFTVTATFKIHNAEDDTTFNFDIDYVVDGDDVYVGGDVDELGHAFLARCDEAFLDDEVVRSSTDINAKQRIVADDEGYDVEESIDDLADAVDDIQDTMDDIEEDTVDIETDNNITNHFIAECDACHGVFISALVETDQEVYSVSGKCPLCDRESEQYLKWVIKKAANADTIKIKEDEYLPPAQQEEESVIDTESETTYD